MAWQININRSEYTKPVDMTAVEAACAQWMTDDQLNKYGDRGEFIYVEFGTVVDAVNTINALGYTTDEDEYEADEDDA